MPPGEGQGTNAAHPASLPHASVVVPAYNAAGTLPLCLTALAAQDYPRAAYEIVVVDDGSTDATAAIAAAAGATVIAQPNTGPAATRNRGAAAAAGEIILFTDADCEPQPDWLTLMLQPFADPAVAGVKGSYRTRQREVVARLAQYEFEERYELLARRPTIDFVDTHAAAFRAAVFHATGGFDPAFVQANNEDVDLSYRLAEQGYRLVFQRWAVVYHRHVASWRRYARLKMRRGYWRMLVYRLHPGKALRDSYTPQVLKLQVLLAYAALACLLAAPLAPTLALAALLSLALLAASGWRFCKRVLDCDRTAAAWAPWFLIVHALAFATGIAAGLIGMIFVRPGHNSTRPEQS